jgi:hypothetical protein
LAQLEELRAQVLKEEAEVREREAQALRLAAGAFPALSGGVGAAGVSTRGGGGGGAGGAAGGGRGARLGGGGPGLGSGHRVLLVDSRTKRVKVESYSRSGGLESEDQEEDVGEAEAGMDERVPPPAREVEFVRVQRGPATRWVDLKGGDGTVKYVALRAAA